MIDLSGIKHIIFDFGGVIININPKLTIHLLKDLGLYQANKLFIDFDTTSILHKLELGKISNNEFLMYIKQHCTKDVSLHELTQAWNAMLLDIPPKRIELLKQLKKIASHLFIKQYQRYSLQAL